ncbi:MmpS family transport accessory protein [Pseudonocardia spirodelae]|uniref:MmpS family transport accessory protein n=1 Tax=Pseudonocardia spirodelae TaxID=3133431 RepID=A0ABU8TCG7_9PSEU
MTTSQNRHGAPDRSGPPQQHTGPHARGPQTGPQPYGTPGPRHAVPAHAPYGGAPQGRPPYPPQYAPGRHYDGNPDVPFGGPPFGRTDPGGLPRQSAAPRTAQPWPTAAQRPGVPQQRSAPHAVAAAPRNGFGVTALVLGILGLLFSLIPIVGVIAWPLVILGLVFGALGIVRAVRGRATNRGVAIAGTVLSALGLVVCVVYVAAVASAVSDLPTGAVAAPAATAPESDAVATAPAATAGGDVITYEVTGSGTAGNITYVKDTSMGMEQVNGTSLPWRKEVTFDGGVLTFQPLSLVAQSGSGGNGEITCRILRNGQEVTSSTSSGPYAVVSCSGS